MPAQQIAQNLAFINWTVLAGLAIGSFAAVVLARARTEAPRGYLAFTAICAAAFAGLAWLSDGALAEAGSAHATTDPLIEQVRRGGLGSLGIAALLWAVTVRRAGPRSTLATVAPKSPGTSAMPVTAATPPAIANPRPATAIFGAIGLAGAGLALAAGAYGWAGGLINGAPLLIQLVVLSAATGGVFAAMILGHWYLVTPKLGEAPLILLSRLLLWIIAFQLVLFVVWLATGAGIGTQPFGALVGPWALFVWLRLIVGLVFPLIVSWAAVQTARTRSMESATGLLYINVGAIAAGTILASGLYFGAGLLT